MISPPRFDLSVGGMRARTRVVKADYARLKSGAKHLLPNLKSSHRLEVMARSLGWSTAAAMQAAFRDISEGESLAIEATPLSSEGLKSLINQADDDLTPRLNDLAPSLIAWLSRSRFKMQHPKTDPWVQSGPFSAIEGLLASIHEHRRLSIFIGLPGQIGDPAWVNSLPHPQREDLKPVVHHASLAAALALCTGLTAEEIAKLSRDDLEFNHAPVQRTYLSRSDGIEFGSMVGDLSDWHLALGTGNAHDPAFIGPDGPLSADQLDAAVFQASSIAGQPSTIEDLRLSSAVLSAAMCRLSPDGCAARLGCAWQDIAKALPREAALAEENWTRHLENAERQPGLTAARNKAFHGEVFRGAGPVQPLLDDWLDMVEKVKEIRQAGTA